MTLLVGISLLFGAALAVATALLWRAYRRLHALEAQIGRLARELESSDEELAALLGEVGGSRIIVDIINPMTLARSRSRWGAAFVGVAPRMVRRRVYDTVAREMKAQLAAQQVEARLEIFHPSGS
ncbi:hypothetical protein [Salinisphaera orenii]|uniref:Uncharacterized protein n=1 Tax=Salinisphaera orenii YIM 95161 TaxID=1051139 RepID=A0A423Q0F1_9GAMM|nr:hypothetical protein [Salinisphaera halophila]ROO31735.1 hypothetical protein SAHL_06325 [Salinisphaera halophila YIM 95161]